MKKLLITGMTFLCIIAFVKLSFAAEITLQWDANSVAPDGYRVFQRFDGGVYDYTTPIGEVAGDVTTYTVSNLSPGLYYFVVRAFVGSVESGDSNEASWTGSVPVPQNLRVIAEIAVLVDGNGNIFIAQKAE